MATTMSPFHVVASTETVPIDWSSLNGRANTTKKVTPSFSVYDNDILVGYCIIYRGPYFFDEYKTIMVTINSLEVHPDYQRRGIATQLMNKVVDENPDVHIVLETTANALPFYASCGFKVLYLQPALYSGDTLIKAIDGLNVKEFALSREDCEDEDGDYMDTSKAGCVWVDSQSRFVDMDRSYEQELFDVRCGSEYEIETVVVQTPELQLLALNVCNGLVEDVVYYITNPCKEAIELAISLDPKLAKQFKV